MMRSLVRLASAVAAVLLLGACGDTDSVSSTGSGQPEAVQVVAAAGTASERFDSVDMRLEIDAGGFVTIVEGTTALDGSMADLRLRTDAQGQITEMPVRVVDGVMYYGSPDGSTWFALTPEELAEVSGLDVSAAPQGVATDVLSKLSEVSDGVDERGPDQVNGVATTRYRFDLPTESLVADGMAAGRFSEALGDQITDAMPATVQVQLWIDADGLPRRIAWSIPMDMSAMGAGEVEVSTAVDYLDWGAALSVEAPPADQVRSLPMPGG